MKILIATPLYPPQIGGPATHTEILESGLGEYDMDVSVVSFGTFAWLPKGIRHIVYFLVVLFRSFSCTTIYVLDPVSVGVPVRLASSISGKPYVLRVAGDYAWEQGVQRFGVRVLLDEFVEHLDKQPRRARSLARSQTFVAKKAAHIVVPSNYLKNIVEKWGIDKEKIAVVENSYVPEEGVALTSELEQIFIARDKVIVSAARLVPWKGMKVLIETLPQIQEEFPNTCLIIAGDGPQEPSLKARAKEMGVAEDVYFVGRLEKKVLRGMVSKADVFVLNTAYEGFSHQILEVMSVGVPVVSTPVGGNPELIENDKEGLLVEYNDANALTRAVGKVFRDEQFRTELSSAAMSKSKLFTKKKMIRKIANVLRAHSA